MISFDIRIAFLAQEDEKLEETCQRHLKCSGPFEATPLRLWHNSQLAQPTTVLYCWFKYIIVFLSHKAATLQAQCHSSPHGNRLLRLRPSWGCCPDLPTPEMLRNENIFNVMKSSFGVQTTPGRGRRVNKLSRSLRRCFWTKPHLFKNDHHTFSTRCGRSLVIVSIYLIIYGIKAYILQKDNKNDKYNFHWPFPTCNGWPPHRALVPLDPQEPDFHLWPLPENDPIMNENLVTIGTHFFFPHKISF